MGRAHGSPARRATLAALILLVPSATPYTVTPYQHLRKRRSLTVRSVPPRASDDDDLHTAATATAAAAAAAARHAAAAVLTVQLLSSPVVPSCTGSWYPLRPASAVAMAPASADAVDPTVDEVWNLVKKFSLDQSYNGQDWPAARAKYSAVAREKGSFEGAKQLAASLGDKYSRVIDPQAYAKMARFDLIGAGVLLAPDESGKLSAPYHFTAPLPKY